MDSQLIPAHKSMAPNLSINAGDSRKAVAPCNRRVMTHVLQDVTDEQSAKHRIWHCSPVVAKRALRPELPERGDLAPRCAMKQLEATKILSSPSKISRLEFPPWLSDNEPN